jgi:4-nitrophenyl phosphatase
MVSEIERRIVAARGFVFDLDGTLVLGNRSNHGLRPLPGAIEVLEFLGVRGTPFALLTNGTTRTPAEYVELLRAAGLPLPDDSVITPSSVAAEYFVRNHIRRALVLGIEGVWKPLAAAGVDVVHAPLRTPVDAVFIGWCPEFTSADIECACAAIRQGARLFAGSLARHFATADGRVPGTTRTMCAMIRQRTGARPILLGKPAPEALAFASAHLAVGPTDLVVVGDDPSIEILMARRAHACSVAVTTGTWRGEGAEALPIARRPDLIVHGVGDLLRILRDR